jgi:putative ABC transport system permease protein
MKQNPFYSFISVLSTAVTIAFVMVAYMAYDLNSSDLTPEVNRTRSVFSSGAYSYRTKDHGNVNGGMSHKTARAITEDIPSAERVSLHLPNHPFTCEALGGEGSKGRKRGRFVDRNWWSLFNYEFVAGRYFSEEEYQAGRNVVVVTERLAREMFRSADVTGREMLIDYKPYTICGVVKDVSSQFVVACSDFWANYLSRENVETSGNGSERVSGNTEFILLAAKGKVGAVKEELERSVERFNETLRETTFEMEPRTYSEYMLSDFSGIHASLLYGLLICIFLIIPAVNISGLISSMLDKRYGEIGVRKAYGASGMAIIRQFLSENLLLVGMGGAIGLLLSFLMIYLFRSWLLGVSAAYVATPDLSWWMFFRPPVFVAALLSCLLFNLLSTLIPVWHTSKKHIIETLNT